MNIQHSKIINPSIFSDLSLEDSIWKLSESKLWISDEKIINLIIKYFFAYRYPESSNEKVALKEIEELFSIAHFFFFLSRYPWTWVNLEHKHILDTLNFLQNNGYPLSMLWDISATTIIFKSIVESIVNPDEFEWRYVWLDLWTWSWILLLAQYLQAKRSWFDHITNIWIEILEWTAKISDELVSKLWVWKIINWDTTNSKTYEIIWDNVKITHISNENIPSNWIRMTGENDPFHQNNRALFKWLNWRMVRATSFFPRRIDMCLDLWQDQKKEKDMLLSQKKDACIDGEVKCGDWIYPSDGSLTGISYNIYFPLVLELFLQRTGVGRKISKSGNIGLHLDGPRYIVVKVTKDVLSIVFMGNKKEQNYRESINWSCRFEVETLARLGDIGIYDFNKFEESFEDISKSSEKLAILFTSILLQVHGKKTGFPKGITFRKATIPEIESLGRW